MGVLPSYRIQVTNASDCAHVAVYTKEILGKYEYASNSSCRNFGTRLKNLKAIKQWVILKPTCNNQAKLNAARNRARRQVTRASISHTKFTDQKIHRQREL